MLCDNEYDKVTKHGSGSSYKLFFFFFYSKTTNTGGVKILMVGFLDFWISKTRRVFTPTDVCCVFVYWVTR